LHARASSRARLALQDDARFTFAPGQWLDLWPEGHALPGGYSIASTPAQFARDGTIELAVRRGVTHARTQAHAGSC
jgi:NAD(P)H-flavin reductase